MLEIMQNLPDHVIGVRATGGVTADEINKVVVPAVECLVAKYDQIHYLLLLENEMADWSVGGMAADAKKFVANLSKWTRVAVVTDQASVRNLVGIFKMMNVGKTKAFKVSELEQAKAWVSVPDGATPIGDDDDDLVGS